MKTLGILLTICRAIYFFWFFVAFCGGIYLLYFAVQSCMRTHSVPGLLVYKSSGVIVLTIVTGLACLLMLIGKSSSSGWSVAACLILTFSWVADITSETWRKGLGEQIAHWPWIVFGIVGIAIFCLPYRGWRPRILMPTEKVR